jgi:hypothetical protein
MRWSGIGTRRPPSCRSSASARVAFQRQRFAKKRRGERREHEVVLEPRRVDHREDAVEREAVLLAERDDDAVVGGRRPAARS